MGDKSVRTKDKKQLTKLCEKRQTKVREKCPRQFSNIRVRAL